MPLIVVVVSLTFVTVITTAWAALARSCESVAVTAMS